MPRHDDGEEIWPRALHGEMGDGGDVVLAWMRACRKPYAASGERRGEFLVAGQIDRRRRRVDLEIADRDGARRAERGEALGEALVLGEHQAECREQRTAQAGAVAPAAEGAERHAAVDEHERDVERIRLQHEVRPDFRFDEHRKVGLPMLEKPPHIVLIVERHILVHGALRQPRPRELRRGDRAGGEQQADLRVLGGDRIDHRQHGIGLADARGMEPHKEAGWARHARLAVALSAPRRLLLADAGAPGKQQRRDRRGIARQRAIGAKREGRLGGILDLHGW